MTPQDAFGVVLRSLGVIALIVGMLYVASGVLSFLSGEMAECGWYLIIGVIIGFLGRYLLSGAPRIMNIAYPNQHN
jgi:NhaP-type Na+/H+ or K+/H+ antiporter